MVSAVVTLTARSDRPRIGRLNAGAGYDDGGRGCPRRPRPRCSSQRRHWGPARGGVCSSVAAARAPPMSVIARQSVRRNARCRACGGGVSGCKGWPLAHGEPLYVDFSVAVYCQRNCVSAILNDPPMADASTAAPLEIQVFRLSSIPCPKNGPFGSLLARHWSLGHICIYAMKFPKPVRER